MYDLFTSTVLFFLLFPGVLISLPAGVSPILAAILFAVVFYLINAYVSPYVPAWGIWIIAAGAVVVKLFLGRAKPAAPTPFMTNPIAATTEVMTGGFKKLFK